MTAVPYLNIHAGTSILMKNTICRSKTLNKWFNGKFNTLNEIKYLTGTSMKHTSLHSLWRSFLVIISTFKASQNTLHFLFLSFFKQKTSTSSYSVSLWKPQLRWPNNYQWQLSPIWIFMLEHQYQWKIQFVAPAH